MIYFFYAFFIFHLVCMASMIATIIKIESKIRSGEPVFSKIIFSPLFISAIVWPVQMASLFYVSYILFTKSWTLGWMDKKIISIPVIGFVALLMFAFSYNEVIMYHALWIYAKHQ